MAGRNRAAVPGVHGSRWADNEFESMVERPHEMNPTRGMGYRPNPAFGRNGPPFPNGNPNRGYVRNPPMAPRAMESLPYYGDNQGTREGHNFYAPNYFGAPNGYAQVPGYGTQIDHYHNQGRQDYVYGEHHNTDMQNLAGHHPGEENLATTQSLIASQGGLSASMYSSPSTENTGRPTTAPRATPIERDPKVQSVIDEFQQLQNTFPADFFNKMGQFCILAIEMNGMKCINCVRDAEGVVKNKRAILKFTSGMRITREWVQLCEMALWKEITIEKREPTNMEDCKNCVTTRIEMAQSRWIEKLTKQCYRRSGRYFAPQKTLQELDEGYADINISQIKPIPMDPQPEEAGPEESEQNGASHDDVIYAESEQDGASHDDVTHGESEQDGASHDDVIHAESEQDEAFQVDVTHGEGPVSDQERKLEEAEEPLYLETKIHPPENDKPILPEVVGDVSVQEDEHVMNAEDMSDSESEEEDTEVPSHPKGSSVLSLEDQKARERQEIDNLLIRQLNRTTAAEETAQKLQGELILQEEAAQELQARVTTAESEKKALEIEVEGHEKSIALLQSLATEAESAKQQLLRELQEKDNTITTIEMRATVAQNRASEEEIRVNRAESKVAALEADLLVKENIISTTEARAKKAETRANTAEGAINSLEKKLQENEDMILATKNRYDDEAAKVAMLRTDLDSHKKSAKKSQEEARSFREELEKMKNTIKNQNVELNEQKEFITEASKFGEEMKELRALFNEQHTKIENAKRAARSLKEELGELKAKKKEQNAVIGILQFDQGNLKATKNNQDTLIASLQSDRENLEATKNKQDAMIASLQSDRENLKTQIELLSKSAQPSAPEPRHLHPERNTPSSHTTETMVERTEAPFSGETSLEEREPISIVEVEHSDVHNVFPFWKTLFILTIAFLSIFSILPYIFGSGLIPQYHDLVDDIFCQPENQGLNTTDYQCRWDYSPENTAVTIFSPFQSAAAILPSTIELEPASVTRSSEDPVPIPLPSSLLYKSVTYAFGNPQKIAGWAILGGVTWATYHYVM